MKPLRVAMLALAVVQLAIAGLTALVGGFADGGDAWSRLLLIVVHPICAIALLILAAKPRLPGILILLIVGLLAVNIASDLYAASLISRGVIKGDWFLPLIFSVIPSIGIVYALILVVARPRSNSI